MHMKLAPDDKTFFTLVSAATFSNPFGEEREDLDRRLADQFAGAGGGPDLARLLRHLESRLASLDAKGRGRVTLYEEPDRAALEHAVLFEAFHRFSGAFDRAIEDQLASERPVV